jgi:hypothetical protein
MSNYIEKFKDKNNIEFTVTTIDCGEYDKYLINDRIEITQEKYWEIQKECQLINGSIYEKDNINPHHYKTGGIETFDYIEAKLSKEEVIGFCRGNCLKYISRCSEKGGKEDLQKAEWYLKKLIKLYE